MPPPPLVFHNGSPPDNYLASESTFVPHWVPGIRQASQPIPIEPAHSNSEPVSYPLGSQESVITEISNSLRPSPPPLTATSDIPTPYTIRTPAATSASTSTARPVLISPISPTPDETEMENTSGELVRVKSHPDAGPIMEIVAEGSSSRSFSRGQSLEIAQLEDDIRMEEEDVQEEPLSPEAEISEEATRLATSPPRTSLTRLVRDIGNYPPHVPLSDAPSRLPPYLQPLMDERAAVFGTRWSQPAPISPAESTVPPNVTTPRRTNRDDSHSGDSDSDELSHIGSPSFNELGPLPRSNSSEYQSRPWRHENLLPQLSYRQPTELYPRLNSVNMLGWGEAYTSHPVISPANQDRSSNEQSTETSRIVPPRLQNPASSSSISSDFRSLPLPVTNSSAGSPSSVERRLDTIESRLERARGRSQRSPPTPPMLASMHSYEGFRNRNNASRPYDRSRPTPMEEGLRRLSSTRPSVRPAWLDSPSSSSTATVPPPRPRPATTFGFDTTSPGPSSARSYSNSDSPSQAFNRTINADTEAVIFPTLHRESIQRENDRSRYLQARLNMLDDLRTGPYRAPSPNPPFAAPAWSNFPVHDRTDFPLGTHDRSRQLDQMAERSTVFNRPTWLGASPTTSQYPSDHTNFTTDDLPVRPGNRRWMSFDEGERESSRNRDDTRTQHPQDSLGALNRDVNEAIGRRLSQPRRRVGSISRTLRDRLGPDWEDTRVPDSATTADMEASSSAPIRHRVESQFGEMETSETQAAGHRREGDSMLPQRNIPRDPYLFALHSARQERSRDRSATSSPADELAAFIDRRRRDRPAFGGEEAELLFLERLRANHNQYNGGNGSSMLRMGPDGSEFMSFRNNDGLEGIMDISSESPFAFAYLNSLRRPNSVPHTHFSNITITNDMDAKEKLKIVQCIIKSVSRLPSGPKKRAAESTLNQIKYDQFNAEVNTRLVDGMEKDEYCSVCHDDYEEESEITITPCKHMYHKGCLDTWLHTPNISSCPMCRRDLAALAYLTKVVPSKNLDDALPLWMAVVS